MRLWLLIPIVLSLGCSTRSAPPAAEQFASFDVCGYHVEVRSAGYRRRSVDSNCFSSGAERRDDVSVTLDDLTLKIANGTLSLNGRDLGAVKPGDRISLNGDGAVTVNGESRTAAGGGTSEVGGSG